MPVEKLNGVELYYETHGHGFPLVLIGGFNADHLVFANLVEDYAKHFQVIVFDNRGIGQSSVPDHPYTIAQMADDTANLCQHLGITEAYFNGSSMGGKILQNLACRYPTLCKKIVITNSYHQIDVKFLLFLQGKLALMKAGADIKALTQITIPWAFGDKFLSNPDNVAMLIERNVQNPFPMTLKGFQHQMAALQDTKNHATVR